MNSTGAYHAFWRQYNQNRCKPGQAPYNRPRSAPSCRTAFPGCPDGLPRPSYKKYLLAGGPWKGDGVMLSAFPPGRSLIAFLLVAWPSAPIEAGETGWIPLSTGPKALEAWHKPTDLWSVAGGAAVDPKNPRRLVAQAGQDILIPRSGDRANNLVSRQEFTDVEVHVEFLILADRTPASSSWVCTRSRSTIRMERRVR